MARVPSTSPAPTPGQPCCATSSASVPAARRNRRGVCTRRAQAQRAAVAALVRRLTAQGLRPEQVLIALESEDSGRVPLAHGLRRDTVLRWAMEALSDADAMAGTPAA